MTGEAKTGAEPPQVLLTRTVRERTQALGAELADHVKKNTGEDLEPNFVGFDLGTFQFPVQLGEADAMRPIYLRYEPNEGWAEVALSLFSDKSPYMMEEDIAEFGDSENTYRVICLPELPPLLVLAQRIEGKDDLAALHDYLHAVKAGEQPAPHYLNGDEAQQLITALSDSELGKYIDKDEGLSAVAGPTPQV